MPHDDGLAVSGITVRCDLVEARDRLSSVECRTDSEAGSGHLHHEAGHWFLFVNKEEQLQNPGLSYRQIHLLTVES